MAAVSCRLIAAMASPEGSVVSAGGGGRTGREWSLNGSCYTLRLHAAKVHYHKLWFASRFAKSGGIPEGKLFECEP